MAIDTINRRGLFSGATAALLGGIVAFKRGARAMESPLKVSLVSAARVGEIDGGALIGADGLTGFSLPGRAHAITPLPWGEVVLIGRRPGAFAAFVNPRDPDNDVRLFAPETGHRFAGHAALSPDGHTLATSEIDAETGAGTVVLRDARSGAPRAMFPAGIEPHDLLFARGGSRLVVAIGGIARAAEVKGPAINAGNIESAILEMDPNSGAILKRHELPADMKSLSLRHMALAPGGETIAFGMQDQDRSEMRPLMGCLHVGGGIELFPLPADDEGRLRAYIGSVAVDSSGRYVAATSPKGGVVGLWSLMDGNWLGGFVAADVCGLAPDKDPAAFWATTGLGDVVQLRANEAGLTAQAHWQAAAAFDNHLARI
jgi:uncharacterized protein